MTPSAPRPGARPRRPPPRPRPAPAAAQGADGVDNIKSTPIAGEVVLVPVPRPDLDAPGGPISDHTLVVPLRRDTPAARDPRLASISRLMHARYDGGGDAA
jgi:hypothetical protein